MITEEYQILFMFLAVVRIYLEVIGFDFEKLPFSKRMAVVWGVDKMKRFHRVGLICCVVHILITAPTMFLS